MHRNTVRLALAGIAVFYAIFGGLLATDYFSLWESDRLAKAVIQIESKHSGIEYLDDPAYEKAEKALREHVVTHPDDTVVMARIHLLQSVLLWGTVALGVGASVLFLTRGKRAG